MQGGWKHRLYCSLQHASQRSQGDKERWGKIEGIIFPLIVWQFLISARTREDWPELFCLFRTLRAGLEEVPGPGLESLTTGDRAGGPGGVVGPGAGGDRGLAVHHHPLLPGPLPGLRTIQSTPVPVTAGGEVGLLPDTPAEAALVPEDEPVLAHVSPHRPANSGLQHTETTKMSPVRQNFPSNCRISAKLHKNRQNIIH